jgi:hypothetical protein
MFVNNRSVTDGRDFVVWLNIEELSTVGTDNNSRLYENRILSLRGAFAQNFQDCV